MEEVNIKKIKRKSIKKRKVNELKNEEGDEAGDGLPTSKESEKKESVGLDMEDKNYGQIDTNLSDGTEFSCSGMGKTGSKHSKASKKKKENELNKSEKLFVSSEAENVEDLKEEVLTELLNDAGKGKLKKVKKTKLKKRKINEGNLNDKIEDDSKKLKGEIEDESKIAVSENDVINSSSSSCHPAIEYLISWKKNKNEWSFKKTRQIWLLKNMYDQTKVFKMHQ